jgi:hypothetical protein
MVSTARFFVAAAFAAVAFSANAENRIAVNADPDRAARVTQELGARQQLLLQRGSAAAGPKSTHAIASAAAALPRVNPHAAYPPSCLADPLPDQTSGPTYTTTANLAAYNRINGTTVLEGVTIRIWRIACSSADSNNSAVLMRIQRQSQYEGDANTYPLFPVIRISQGAIGYDAPGVLSWPRTAIEPDTVISDIQPDTPLVNSLTFILENYDSTQTTDFNYDQAFGIRFDNLFASNNFFYINVPTYSPTVGTYPDAFQNMQISGYLATSWYTPTTSGEGIVMQVYELLGVTDSFVINFTWSAYDPSGLPFWLTGQVTVPRGTRTVTSPMFYVTGGGLGGNAGTANPPTPWGTATFGFPDCNHLNLTYASNPGLPAFVPQGSGTRNWVRLGRANGMPCE